ncbi:MAG TPA: tripartite tricarboxylate transporter substrate binding protein [Burkholderiaceae bacterium]|nr:tripartite tricarboxylate transporter substrate binding protein [Burkholderiaceae bacterium]
MNRLARYLTATLLCAVAAGAGAQQAFPSKPIRLVVPYAPGGTTDIMARALQGPMSEDLGQTVVVDNKAGAGGSIAMKDTANSAPDGYTVVFVNNGNVAVTPVMQKDPGYDGIRSFAPIGMVASSPMLVVVNGEVPVSDLKGFIDYSKKNPGKLEYATAGPGSFGHLSTELFLRAAGLQMVHVPYKGQAPTLNAVLAGETKLLITSPSSAMNSQIAAGKLKLLGVGTATESPLYPGTPTVASVLPGYQAESWFALLAPAGTPPEVIAKLNRALNKALAMPDLQKRLNTFGLVAVSSTPDELRERIAAEVKRWGTVIRESGIKVE